MASSFALKKFLVAPTFLARSLGRSPAAAASQYASRFFNTNAARRYEDDDSDSDDRVSEREVPTRHEYLPNPFSAFSRSRRLSQLLNMIDQDALPFAGSSGAGSGLRRGWDARETGDGLYLRMDMPGLGKEDVKVSVEQNTLIIKGEGAKESDDEEYGGSNYSSRIDLPEKVYKTGEIKAEMKNGVLKVTVPKVKEEERTDVFHVNVE